MHLQVRDTTQEMTLLANFVRHIFVWIVYVTVFRRNEMGNKSVKKLALSGVYLALTLVFIMAGSFMPGIEMTLLAAATAVGTFVIIETGVKNGILFFAAASILGFIIVPNKLAMIPYIMFFGLYPAVKYFAEKLEKAAAQLTVKFAYFITVLLIAYFMLFDVFFGSLDLPEWMPVFAVIPAALILFVILDAALTAIINIYFKRVHSKFM